MLSVLHPFLLAILECECNISTEMNLMAYSKNILFFNLFEPALIFMWLPACMFIKRPMISIPFLYFFNLKLLNHAFLFCFWSVTSNNFVACFFFCILTLIPIKVEWQRNKCYLLILLVWPSKNESTNQFSSKSRKFLDRFFFLKWCLKMCIT